MENVSINSRREKEIFPWVQGYKNKKMIEKMGDFLPLRSRFGRSGGE
jgi:hypothetical protein